VTIATPDGTVTATESGKTVEVKGPEGATATVTEGADKSTYEGKDAEGNVTRAEAGKGADMSGMGVPQYPGSTLRDDKSQAKIEAGGRTTYGMSLLTQDAPDKVTAWYKAQLTDATIMSGGQGAMVMGKDKAGANVTVTASKEDDGTHVAIVVTK
jgi:hypothetical protein